ncbi:MAG: hypothetical protein LBR60_06685 [Fibrobacter sp.]|jgi:hypothetical protein|nr:hypothetical protein [Fibrobacter sp.]
MKFLFGSLCFLFFTGCSEFHSSEAFSAHYETACRTDISLSGTQFSVLPLSRDYEKAKWGVSPDSGFRVLFWGEFNSSEFPGKSFLISSGDTLPALLYRKSPAFDTGRNDSYVFAFSKPVSKPSVFTLSNFGKYGSISFKLKKCSHLRFKE